ncbi:MAG: UDP-glucose 4-epimerase GalE [Pseudomonadota bacterium]|nr:UDP-glucose 4-epimerase GalE [Pseudomonadota bacterium]
MLHGKGRRVTGRRFLVTGGAGFVGSHVVLTLAERGDEVVIVDNLSQGHRAAVLAGVRLIELDLAATDLVDGVVADGPWDAVLHFAALSLVGESMRQPFRYLLENAGNGIRLIESCVRHGVRRFVLSSTANLFGAPEMIPIVETARLDSGSPYGESKQMIERALVWADRIHGMRSASLRYFNAAGADPGGRLGEDHTPETHLVPLAIDAALGRPPELVVFGTDYPTPDGTCIRDYVHVSDLADAHLRAVDRLDERSVTYNLGNGQGASVLQVIEAVAEISGHAVPHVFGPRRPGDPPVLVASSERIRRETGWTPQFPELREIVRTAHAWRVAHPHGYAS